MLIPFVIFGIIGSFFLAKSFVKDTPVYLWGCLLALIAIPAFMIISDDIKSDRFESYKPVQIENTRIYEAEIDGRICTAKIKAGDDDFSKSPAGQITKFVNIQCEEK